MVLLNIVKHQDQKLIDPVIITLSPEPENSMLQQFTKLGIRTESLKLSRAQGILQAGKRLGELLEKIDPDIIHSHGFRADGLAAKIRHRALKVSTLHNDPFVDYPMKFGSVKGKFMALQSRRSIKKLDLPIACSKSIQEQMDRRGIRTGCIQNGIDIELFTPIQDHESDQLKGRLDIPLDKLILIVSGSLIKRKDVETILHGISQSKRNDLLLLVLGDGPEREHLVNSYGRDARISFLGFQENVLDYLRCADSVLSASVSEGLPNGIIESMACELHCILSDIASHRELNLPEGNQFFHIGDSKKLAYILDQMTVKDAMQTGKQNRDVVKRHFSAKKMARDYQTHYLKDAGEL